MEFQRQSVPFIRTKLHRPPVTEDLVHRHRLHEQMDLALLTPLTMVCAPAGYGKSMLVSHWADSLETPCAWLSLGEEDGDLRGFLEYFLAAIDDVSPGFCQTIQELVTVAEFPPVPVVAGHLLNELDAIDTPCLIVLDDYHRIDRGSPVHQLIARLLEHPPRHVHLVLITRQDPPLPLQSLRASNRFTEIRLRDLQFTTPETAELLARLGELPVSEQALTNLQHEIEGWAVGLRLVSLALRHTSNPDEYLQNLRGGLAHTREYLLEEVLSALPPEVCECLMKASILDRFCPELVDVVCGRDSASSSRVSDGREPAHFLRESSLFTISLDSRGEWFRFHHLFQELLKQQLNRRAAPDDIAALHLRASEWFEVRGLLEESITHALAAREPGRAAEIVLRRRYDLLNSDRWHFTEKLLLRLPEEIRQGSAGLILMQAWIAYWRWELENMMGFAVQAEALLDDGSDRPATLRGELDFFNGQVAYWTGEIEKSRELLERALPALGGVGGIVEGNVEIMLGLARRINGEGAMAIQALENRVRTADSGESAFISQALAALVFIHLTVGDLAAAHVCTRQIMIHAEKCGMSNTAAWARYFHAYTHFQSLEINGAIDGFTEVNRHRYVLEPKAVIDGLTALAITYQLVGDTQNAEKTAESLMTWAVEAGAPELLEVAASCRARLSVLQGNPEAAVSWTKTVRDVPELSDLFMWLEVPSITKVRVLAGLGSEQNLSHALELLETIRERSERWRFDCHTIEVAVLKAVVLAKQGRKDEASAELETVLSLAAPGGWVRPFIEAGAVVVELLERLDPASDAGVFVRRILAAFQAAGSTTGPEASEQSPVAPLSAGKGPSSASAARPNFNTLTNRELDILELLADRLQNKEIGLKLCISTHTVNDHLKHIYSKLGVSGRRRAVERAVDTGLLKRD